nr:hypothetical protein [Metabacillus litoralis]
MRLENLQKRLPNLLVKYFIIKKTSAFHKIKSVYKSILDGFKQTAAAMETINDNSKTISSQIQDLTSQVEDFGASTQEISATGGRTISIYSAYCSIR